MFQPAKLPNPCFEYIHNNATEDDEGIQEELQKCQQKLKNCNSDLSSFASKAFSNEMLKVLEVERHENLMDRTLLLELENLNLQYKMYVFACAFAALLVYQLISNLVRFKARYLKAILNLW